MHFSADLTTSTPIMIGTNMLSLPLLDNLLDDAAMLLTLNPAEAPTLEPYLASLRALYDRIYATQCSLDETVDGEIHP